MIRYSAGTARRASVASIALATCLIAALCAGCAQGEADSHAGVAAYFGDHVISEDEVTSYTRDYRADMGLEDDEDWADFLTVEGMTAKEWREEVIRGKVDRILIEERAAQYGITADASAVDAAIARAREAAGVAANNDRAWSDYLAEQGRTPEEARDAYEFSSIEQQVFSHDIDFAGEAGDDLCNDYIRNNLADQVVRRYSAIEFGLDEEAKASDCLAELAGLEGDALSARFLEMARERYDAGQAYSQDGDMGWDFQFDDYAVDPEGLLRKAMLGPGELYGSVLEGQDRLRVVMCTERASFETIDYSSLESEDLKKVVSARALQSRWATQSAQYLADLESEADVQVAEMPDGLAYDVQGAQED